MFRLQVKFPTRPYMCNRYLFPPEETTPRRWWRSVLEVSVGDMMFVNNHSVSSSSTPWYKSQKCNCELGDVLKKNNLA